MSENDFTLTSGAKLHITTAAFDECSALYRALAKCLRNVEMADDFWKMDASVLKDIVVELVASPEVEQAIFKCGERASYNDQKFGKQLLNDAQVGDAARQDFIEVAAKIIEVDAKPFFEKAFSVLTQRLANAADSPRQP